MTVINQSCMLQCQEDKVLKMKRLRKSTTQAEESPTRLKLVWSFIITLSVSLSFLTHPHQNTWIEKDKKIDFSCLGCFFIARSNPHAGGKFTLWQWGNVRDLVPRYQKVRGHLNPEASALHHRLVCVSSKWSNSWVLAQALVSFYYAWLSKSQLHLATHASISLLTPSDSLFGVVIGLDYTLIINTPYLSLLGRKIGTFVSGKWAWIACDWLAGYYLPSTQCMLGMALAPSE